MTSTAHLDELAHHFIEGALAGDALKAVDFGRRAAARATAELAFEAAARHLEHALGALDLLEPADLLLRCDLQTELAQALGAASDGRYREVAFAAVATACAAGDGERLATAALVLVLEGRIVDAELIALFEEALAALPAAPSALRALVLSGLANLIQWTDDADRRSSGSLGTRLRWPGRQGMQRRSVSSSAADSRTLTVGPRFSETWTCS